ncbi:MAG: transcriptional regulator NrdR [Puniceicoccales bacterium]|jgi:transcriptional repressor NrdR|nr:transcriptional regulator NrdR [Puniceicoccales bacterium]
MRCPKCGYADSRVTDTRAALESSSIRRRRICLACGYRFFTSETICAEFPAVIKRDGREEEFDCDKIRIGLSKAFKKCAAVEEKVEKIYSRVIAEIISKHPDKVSSREIGAITMNLLKASDPVAYLRFASVYKNFETAADFASEFKKMSSDRRRTSHECRN